MKVSYTEQPCTQNSLESSGLNPLPKSSHLSMADIFAELDKAGAADFVLERDHTLPPANDVV